MGIPRLKGFLDSYSQSQVLGCSSTNCKNVLPRVLVIDGPCLAYTIYHKLLSRVNGSNPIGSQPSYADLSVAILKYLGGFEKAHITISKIYFDGFLPPSKRSVRLERLEASLAQLQGVHNAYARGFALAKKAVSFTDLTVEELFSSPSRSLNTPALPFLVPAILEFLRNSQYADKVQVVPEEADIFCADHARIYDSCILSSDSDMLVHDIGAEGRMAFLSSIELKSCPDCGELAIIAKVIWPAEIARRLLVPDMKRLAFEISQDQTVGLNEARRRVQLALSKERAQKFGSFRSQYEDMTLYSLSSGPQPAILPYLDPRVSEFVLQSFTTAAKFADATVEELSGTVHIYLPFLLDDPARASAWDASSDIRRLAYSLISIAQPNITQRTLIEFSRRGARIAPTPIQTMNATTCLRIVDRLDETFASIKGASGWTNNLAYWRTVAGVQVLVWHLQRYGTLPTIVELDEAWNGVHSATGTGPGQGWLGWNVIQLAAQLEGVLYGFRILRQVCDVLIELGVGKQLNNQETRQESPGKREPEEELLLKTLCQYIKDLPTLAALLPRKMELSECNIDIVRIRDRASRAWASTRHLIDEPGAGKEAGSQAAGLGSQAKGKKTRKRRKKERERLRWVDAAADTQSAEDGGASAKRLVNVFGLMEEDG